MSNADLKDYRTDYAIIAHKKSRILLVKMKGYYDVPWRLPQGRMSSKLPDNLGVREVLERMVGCSDIDTLRNTGIVRKLDYSSGDRESYDPGITAKIFIGKTLHFYLAELLCGKGALSKGPRVEAIQMVSRNKLHSFLHHQEADAVDYVLDTYALEGEVALDNLLKSLSKKS